MAVVKPGARLRSVACETEVVVVKGPAGEVDLRCGGASMVAVGDSAGNGASRHTPDPSFDQGTLVGKRYVSDDESIEVLCTKPGVGSLSLGDAALSARGAKPLPASD